MSQILYQNEDEVVAFQVKAEMLIKGRPDITIWTAADKEEALTIARDLLENGRSISFNHAAAETLFPTKEEIKVFQLVEIEWSED